MEANLNAYSCLPFLPSHGHFTLYAYRPFRNTITSGSSASKSCFVVRHLFHAHHTTLLQKFSKSLSVCKCLQITRLVPGRTTRSNGMRCTHRHESALELQSCWQRVWSLQMWRASAMCSRGHASRFQAGTTVGLQLLAGSTERAHNVLAGPLVERERA